MKILLRSFYQVDDFEALPSYPYRDDALLLHQVIWDYVREVLEGHYGGFFSQLNFNNILKYY